MNYSCIVPGSLSDWADVSESWGTPFRNYIDVFHHTGRRIPCLMFYKKKSEKKEYAKAGSC